MGRLLEGPFVNQAAGVGARTLPEIAGTLTGIRGGKEDGMSATTSRPDNQANAFPFSGDDLVTVVTVELETPWHPKAPLDVPRTPRPIGGVPIQRLSLAEVIEHNTEAMRTRVRHWLLVTELLAAADDEQLRRGRRDTAAGVCRSTAAHCDAAGSRSEYLAADTGGRVLLDETPEPDAIAGVPREAEKTEAFASETSDCRPSAESAASAADAETGGHRGHRGFQRRGQVEAASAEANGGPAGDRGVTPGSAIADSAGPADACVAMVPIVTDAARLLCRTAAELASNVIDQAEHLAMYRAGNAPEVEGGE